MRGTILRAGAGVFAAGLLAVGAAAPASANHGVEQDGLVNVAIGDVTILRDVNVALAAQVVAAVCPNVSVSDAVDLIEVFTIDDNDTTQVTVCQARGRQGPVTVTD